MLKASEHRLTGKCVDADNDSVASVSEKWVRATSIRASDDVELQAEQRHEPPTVFTRVTIRHKLRGEVQPQALEKAIRLSENKYCSVGAMISKTARIETTYEIVPETETAAEFEASKRSVER